jgi:thiol-disulfide isomerase/thioredoxin
MNIKQSIAIMAFVFGGLLSLQAQTETVPSVIVKNLNGESVDFKNCIEPGKITIISFWATWCAPCIKELQAIDAKYAEWQEKYNLKLVAVTVDDSRNIKKVKPKNLPKKKEG